MGRVSKCSIIAMLSKSTNRAFEWEIRGSIKTSSSNSAILSSYAVAIGIVRSTMPSIIACMTILASPLLRKIVSGDCRRFKIGSSITSAECSKKETTVLSLWRKIDTCSTETIRPFGASVEWVSIYLVLSSSTSCRKACSVLTEPWYSVGTWFSRDARPRFLAFSGLSGGDLLISSGARIKRCKVNRTMHD